MFHGRKTLEVSKDKMGSKWWHHFHFSKNFSFNSSYTLHALYERFVFMFPCLKLENEIHFVEGVLSRQDALLVEFWDWIASVLPLWPAEAGVFWEVWKAGLCAGVLSMFLTSRRQDGDLKVSIWWKVKCHICWLWGLATQHLFFLSFLTFSVWNIYVDMLVCKYLGRYTNHCCTSGKVVEHL